MMWKSRAGGIMSFSFRHICVEIADIFSINIGEAERLFEVEGDEACIAELQKLPVSMTLFRVGKEGTVCRNANRRLLSAARTVEIVDPTGRGNTSTAPHFAFANGDDPMVGIKANIAADRTSGSSA